MRLVIVFLMIFMSTTSVLAQSGDAPTCEPARKRVVVRIPEIPQAQNNVTHAMQPWCWAAAAQNILVSKGIGVDSNGKPKDQCHFVNAGLGKTNCCDNPTPFECIKPEAGDHPEKAGYPEKVFDSSEFNFEYKPKLDFQRQTWRTLDWTDIVQEIRDTGPFIPTVQLGEEETHTVVVNGYWCKQGGEPTVRMYDPQENEHYYVPYDDDIFRNGTVSFKRLGDTYMIRAKE